MLHAGIEPTTVSKPQRGFFFTKKMDSTPHCSGWSHSPVLDQRAQIALTSYFRIQTGDITFDMVESEKKKVAHRPDSTDDLSLI